MQERIIEWRGAKSAYHPHVADMLLVCDRNKTQSIRLVVDKLREGGKQDSYEAGPVARFSLNVID